MTFTRIKRSGTALRRAFEMSEVHQASGATTQAPGPQLELFPKQLLIFLVLQVVDVLDVQVGNFLHLFERSLFIVF